MFVLLSLYKENHFDRIEIFYKFGMFCIPINIEGENKWVLKEK